MTSSRGRANKGCGRYAMKQTKTTAFTKRGELLRKAWERMSNLEKQFYGYDFATFRTAKEKI